ncbi:hypothetical protein ACT2E5_13625 [Burkholderia vietnamiensis]|uniref:hypothetical protein n=1 Tax=Burkholderia vietnamiensis TaxID=60552 RepID=UPI00402AB6BB
MSDLNAAPSSTDPSPDLQIETKHYADGASATGVAPLPDVSPNGAAAVTPEAGTAAVGEPAGDAGAQLPPAGPAAADLTADSPQSSNGAIVSTSAAGEAGNAGASAALQSPSTSDAGSSAASLSPAAPAAGSDGGDAPTIHSDLAGAIGDAVLTGTGYYRIGGEDAEPAIDPAAHLSRLDAMLAELERKLALGIHTFAHEITAARDHLAKLL